MINMLCMKAGLCVVPRYHNNETVVVSIPEPYRDGYLRELYEVDAFTNYQGKTYPSKFTYKTFAPQQTGGTSSNDLVETRMVTGTVDKISEISEWKHFEPQPVCYAQDCRGTGQHYQYFMTNYVIMEEQNIIHVRPNVLENMILGQQSNKVPAIIKHDKYLLALGCVGIVAIPTAVVMCLVLRSRKGK